MLLHGFTNSWQVWRPVLPALEERYAVFAPTLAGHLGGPLFDGAPVSIESMVDIIERQLDAEGIQRAHMVGNSLGGWLSLELAMRGRALSVVGICPAGGWESGSPEERAIARLFRQNSVTLRIVRPWLETIAGRPRMRVIAFRDMAARPSRIDAPTALATLEAAAGCTIVPEMLALAKAGRLFGDLESIQCSVRVAHATRDRLFKGPAYYTKLRRLLPDAEWVQLEGLGHIPMTDDPDRIAQVILER